MFKAKEKKTHTICNRHHQTDAATQSNDSYDSTGRVSTSTHSTFPHISRPLRLDSKEISAYRILLFRLILELLTLGGYGSHITKSWPPQATSPNLLPVYKPLVGCSRSSSKPLIPLHSIPSFSKPDHIKCPEPVQPHIISPPILPQICTGPDTKLEFSFRSFHVPFFGS